MAGRFDTLVAADALEDAGIDRTHAKAIAAQLRVASDAGEPVTRHELEVAVGGLKAELAALETRLTWRLVGFMVAIAGATIAVLEYLRPPTG